MSDLVKKNNLNVNVESRATSTYEIGNNPHKGAIAKLKEKSIPLINHKAKQITDSDFIKFDYIVGMDNSNVNNLKSMSPNKEAQNKIYMATSVLENPYEIQDPWYDENFERTYRQLSEVLPLWIEKIKSDE
ncbi:arsenate reductase/protein-tyrosine-phosphatase family protein [Companilactobacillus sp. DQM5]|uniref:arsenate reductase/protein-tyrosine-phosphatase family protein n=1 Tax=Companilactobacillus sp. DQM5 TaxID=3463359 RepID=UPI004059192F